MGKDVVNGGLEPYVAPGERLMVRVFSGSLALGHLAPPDDSAIPADEAREVCRRAATVVRIEEWRPFLPLVWREWFDGLPEAARVAVWRGCAALHLYTVVGRQ